MYLRLFMRWVMIIHLRVKTWKWPWVSCSDPRRYSLCQEIAPEITLLLHASIHSFIGLFETVSYYIFWADLELRM